MSELRELKIWYYINDLVPKNGHKIICEIDITNLNPEFLENLPEIYERTFFCCRTKYDYETQQIHFEPCGEFFKRFPYNTIKFFTMKHIIKWTYLSLSE